MTGIPPLELTSEDHVPAPRDVAAAADLLHTRGGVAVERILNFAADARSAAHVALERTSPVPGAPPERWQAYRDVEDAIETLARFHGVPLR